MSFLAPNGTVVLKYHWCVVDFSNVTDGAIQSFWYQIINQSIQKHVVTVSKRVG